MVSRNHTRNQSSFSESRTQTAVMDWPCGVRSKHTIASIWFLFSVICLCFSRIVRSDLLRLCSRANASLTMVVTPGCFTHYSLVCCCKREFRVITWMMGSHPFSNFVPRAANLNHESYLGSRTFTAFISLLLPIHAEVAGVHAAPRGDRLNVSPIPLAFDPRSQGHGNLLFTRYREIYWPLVHVIQYTLDHPRYQKGVCVRDSAGARKHDRCRRIRRDS